MNDNIKNLLLLSIVITLVLIPKISFAANDIHDSFSYSNSALAQTAINEETIGFYPYENEVNTINRHANGWSIRWVVTSMIAQISLVTGMSPRDLQSLPICAFGILLMAYLVASKLTKDWRLSLLYTLIIAFDPTVNSLTNGTYIQGWGFIFYFMLIYLAMIIVENKYYLALLKDREHYRPFTLYGSLAACCLVMMYFSYYSTLIYAVITLAIVAGGIMWAGSGRKFNRKHLMIFITVMILIFVALYVVEETIRFALSNFRDLLGTSYDYLASAVSAAGPRFYVGLLSYILIFIPLAFLGIRWFKALRRDRRIPVMRWEDLFITSFIITGLINVAVYTGLGLVDLKYVIMFFSLAALYALTRLRPSDVWIAKLKTVSNIPLRRVFALALAMLFILKFATYIVPIINDDTSIEPSRLNWLSANCLDTDTASISDLRLSGEVMLLHSEMGHDMFNSYVYTPYYLTNLEMMNSSNFEFLNENMDYLIMTIVNDQGSFNVGNWESWTSETDILSSLGSFTFCQKVYTSFDISIWRITIN